MAVVNIDSLLPGVGDGRVMEQLENLVWSPESGLADKQLDQFLVIAR